MYSQSTIALKISGEAFSLNRNSIQDLSVIHNIALGIKKIHDAGIGLVIVVGGGNFCRGINTQNLMDRITTDHVGMLGTLINALVLQNVLENLSIPTRVQSAISITYICESFASRKAFKHLSKNRIVIFATGTGNPFFSTDTASVLRALEMKCSCLLKATNVAGVFASDPSQNPEAQFLSKISYDDILQKNLKIMDFSAIALAKENNLPIKICSIKEHENFLNIVNNSKGKYSLIEK